MSHINIDPLLAYEERITRKRGFFSSMKHTSFFLFQYFLLTGVIFFVLLGILNYSAYSHRVMTWVNPTGLEQARDEVNGILTKATSVSVHASEQVVEEQKEDRESITEKIANSEPTLIYSRNYEARNLMAGVGQEKAPATFALTPYENRIIIPKMNKNIPLVDVEVDPGATFETMHEVFMEELKKGIVRYPGTAKPGEVGNAFIFGHSSNYPWIKSEFNAVFALLDKLDKGDEIIVYYQQKKYIYTVTDHATVKPGDVKTLESRDHTKKELSLMTCWPVGTTLERLIVFAELSEVTENS